jgi:hypothetical protein
MFDLCDFAYDEHDDGSEERPRDLKVDEAKELLKAFFDARQTGVFYHR